jgi:hypothetical protein
MVRWIAFDDDTAEAVVSRLRRGAAEIQSNTPVDAALHASGPSVIVLPSSTPGKLLIARFSRRKIDTALSAPARPSPAEIAALVPPKKPVGSLKKPWWRRLVA